MELFGTTPRIQEAAKKHLDSVLEWHAASAEHALAQKALNDAVNRLSKAAKNLDMATKTFQNLQNEPTCLAR